MSKTYDVAVVGGGHNGLVAAFYLARAGKKVIVLERRSMVGGSAVTEEVFPGYRVSSCSYVLWMLQPKVRDDMRLVERGLKWHTLDPQKFNPYLDGSHMQHWADPAKFRQEIEKLSPPDGAGWERLNAFWDRASQLIAPFMLTDPPTMDQLREHARSINEEDLLDKVLTSSIADIADEFLVDARVKAAVFEVEDVGDPWAPGSAWLELYYQAARVLDYGYAVVEGGMGSVTQLMAQACLDEGVEIRTDAKVTSITTDGAGSTTGVVVNDNWDIPAEYVMVNADPKQTFRKLLDDDSAMPSAFAGEIDSLSSETGYYKYHCVLSELPDLSHYLGREATPEEVAYIHIAPSLEAYKESFEACRAGELPKEVVAHLQFPSLHDDTLTSQKEYVLSVWGLYAPTKLARGTWPERRDEAEALLVDYINRYIPNFKSSITQSELYTPWDLEQRKALPNGNVQHIDLINGQYLGSRVPYQSPINGLWMCGASTHPGGEVSGANGHNAAHALLRTETEK